MGDYTLKVMVQNDFGQIFPVHLPEDPYVLDDILAEHHVFTGRDCRIDDVEWVDFPGIVVESTDDVAELNYIATQFTRHEYDEKRYTGILKALGGGSHLAVDLAAHFDSLGFFADIHSYRDLGVAFLKGRVDKDPDSYSDYYLIECGKFAQRQMRGIFMEDGEFIGFPEGFVKNGYDGHCLPFHDEVEYPYISMYVPIRHLSLPPKNIPREKYLQGPVVETKDFNIKLPLFSSAATIHRSIVRLGYDPFLFHARQGIRCSFTPLGEKKSVIRGGSLGQVAEAAMCYERMNLAQRQAFRNMLDAAELHYIHLYSHGQCKDIPSDGEILWEAKILERMESEHGFTRPVSREPITCIVRNKRLAEAPIQAVFPLSGDDLRELIDSLVLEGPEDKDFQVAAFSLDHNCGHIQKLVDQGATPAGFNEAVAALIDEPAHGQYTHLDVDFHEL